MKTSGLLFAAFVLSLFPCLGAEPERWTDPALPERTILVRRAAAAPPGSPKRKAAIWFHLPGTSGRPVIDPAVPGIVQVAMPPVRADELPAGSDLATATWAACLRVRERLVRDPDYDVDPSRCLVGGTSRGGWIATGIASKRPKDLRGVLVFGAGLHPNSTVGEGAFPAGFSVYIGCGDFDANLPHAYDAARAFRNAGASVSHERYVAEGHVRRFTPRLGRWLAQVVGGAAAGSPIDADLLAQVLAEKDPWLRFRLLEVGRADPAFAAANLELRLKWKAAITAAANESAVTEGKARLASFRQLLRREIELSTNGKGTPEAFVALQTSQTELAAKMPGTPEFVECTLAAARLGGIVRRRTEEKNRFDTHAATKGLRELQAELNATQARLKAKPNLADSKRIRALAAAFAAEAQKVQRAAQFARIQPAPEAELGPDPLSDEVEKMLRSPATAPASSVFSRLLAP